MTPKVEQMSAYNVPSDQENQNSNDDKQIKHHRSPSSTSEILANNSNVSINAVSPAFPLLNRVTSVISPTVVLLVATPIAMRYPLIQLIMFLTILIGSSPLYFIMITFVGKNNKHNYQYKPSQPHRRQPSIVGAINDIGNQGNKTR